MAIPWGWRLARAAGCSLAFGFAVLAVIAILESAADSPARGSDWSLGKPEVVSWIFATLAFPWFALTPLPAAPVWGFVRALSPPALLWELFEVATRVSASLHHTDPLWIECVALAAVYAACVPWESWRHVRGPKAEDTTTRPVA